MLYPLHIVLLDVFGKTTVGLLLLHLQHLGHLRVGSREFQLPAHQPLVDIGPVGPCATVHNLHGELLELLLIAALHGLGDDFLAMDVLLECQQDLVGVDRLDEVVGYLLSDGLVHDVFLLALGHHDHRGLWRYLLDALQGFQSAQSRHHLVEQHQVEGAVGTLLDGIGAIGDRHHLVAFLLQE